MRQGLAAFRVEQMQVFWGQGDANFIARTNGQPVMFNGDER